MKKISCNYEEYFRRVSSLFGPDICRGADTIDSPAASCHFESNILVEVVTNFVVQLQLLMNLVVR